MACTPDFNAFHAQSKGEAGARENVEKRANRFSFGESFLKRPNPGRAILAIDPKPATQENVGDGSVRFRFENLPQRNGMPYGRVIEQKFGRRWDLSDCFVTLCRPAGVPSRQVAGGASATSGYFWAEDYWKGVGWQRVDPTGGGTFRGGFYHTPWFTTESVEMPIVYLSMPEIRLYTLPR